jgi:hypothetical protein
MGLMLQYLAEWQAAFLAVDSFFNDEAKTRLWLITKNPMLGNVAPAHLIASGRADRLMRFIETSLRENRE